jgi:hypothetical protein
MRRAAARAAPRRPKLQRRIRTPLDRTLVAMCRSQLYVGYSVTSPDAALVRLRLRAAQTQSVSLRACVLRQTCNMTSIRGLAWAKARFAESAATLYESTPSRKRKCFGCTLLDLARWCVVRTRSRRGLWKIRHEAERFVADRRVHRLLRMRFAYFETVGPATR